MTTSFDEVHSRSLTDPEGFWGEAAQELVWSRRWDTVLDHCDAPAGYRWFRDGRLNTCYNCLDVHVEGGRADQAALIYDSPVTDTIRRYSFRELQRERPRRTGLQSAISRSL